MVVNDSAACGRQDLSVKRAFIDGSRHPAPCIASGGDGVQTARSRPLDMTTRKAAVKQKKKKKKKKKKKSNMRV